MSRGSRFSTILAWFRTEGDIDEVVAVLPLCVKAVSERTAAPTPMKGPGVKRAAKAASKERTGAERSAAAKRAWEKRRLNAANNPTSEVTQ